MKIRYALLVALSLSLPSYGQKKQSAKATPQIQRVQQIQRILKPNTSRQIILISRSLANSSTTA